MSGSFESVQWNACMHRLDLGLYSHSKEFWGMESETHVKSKGKKSPLPEKILPRGGWNPRHCIKQDSKPNTLPTSDSGPKSQVWLEQEKRGAVLELLLLLRSLSYHCALANLLQAYQESRVCVGVCACVRACASMCVCVCVCVCCFFQSTC